MAGSNLTHSRNSIAPESVPMKNWDGWLPTFCRFLSLDKERIRTMNAGNQGFINLHNATGVLLITLSAVLFLAMIVAGAWFARYLEQEGKEQRRRLRDQQKRHP